MRAALTDGLISAVASAAGFSDKQVFYDRSPLKAPYPYCAIFAIDSDHEFDAINVHEPMQLQFSVREKTLAKVQEAAEAIFDVLDFESNLTVTGWTVLETRRVLSVGARSFGNIWEWVFDYRIWIYKAR